MISAPTIAQGSRAAQDTPAVLDMEASGFGRASYPIEVGYALPDGQTFCTLIQPAPGWTHWDESAEAVHRIPRAAVLQRGRDVKDVAQHLNEHLGGRTVYCDGWANDYSWLAALFDAAGTRPAFRLEHLRTLLNEREASHWHATKDQVASELRLQRHRASSDARVLQITLQRVRAASSL
ncbi:MAG: hypothetical protein AD742_19650 [Methylibium sp. NZG]|nr:MAG: hypothetical protein AD742_19650 [Methylibium sp. NZG]